MTVPEIHRAGLAELVDLGAVTLVEALPEEVFAEAHLLAPTLPPELGYRDVRRYRAGKQDWISAGFPVEHATPATA